MKFSQSQKYILYKKDIYRNEWNKDNRTYCYIY